MKVDSVKFYQAVKMGSRLESHLNTEKGSVGNFENLSLDFSSGIMQVRAAMLRNKVLNVPVSNIMSFVSDDLEIVPATSSVYTMDNIKPAKTPAPKNAKGH